MMTDEITQDPMRFKEPYVGRGPSPGYYVCAAQRAAALFLAPLSLGGGDVTKCSPAPPSSRPTQAQMVIKRFWQGYGVRRAVVQLKRGVDKVSGLYLNHRYKQVVHQIKDKHQRSVFILQYHWRTILMKM